MDALSGRDFARWLQAYHDANPGATFTPLSWLVDSAGRTTYQRLIDWAVVAAAGVASPRVLDLGCGDGMLLALYGAQVPGALLIGIDQSAGELEIARATLQPFQSRLIEGDIASAHLEADSIDVALSHMVIMLVEDPRQVLREIARVLKDGAAFAFTVGGIGPPQGVLEQARAKTSELMKHEGKALPSLDRSFLELDGLAALPWDELGFTGVNVEPIELSRRLSIEEVATYVLSSFYGSAMLSKGSRELLEREVVDRAWEHADENARVEVRMTVALVSARKRAAHSLTPEFWV